MISRDAAAPKTKEAIATLRLSRKMCLSSLDPPTIPGGAFLARFLPEEFSLVNRGVVALPPALCAACP